MAEANPADVLYSEPKKVDTSDEFTALLYDMFNKLLRKTSTVTIVEQSFLELDPENHRTVTIRNLRDQAKETMDNFRMMQNIYRAQIRRHKNRINEIKEEIEKHEHKNR